MPKSAYCKDCREPIRWATTQAGKLIALGASPDPKGTYTLVKRLVLDEREPFIYRERMVAVAVSQKDAVELQARGELLWLAHTAVCTARRPRQQVPEGVLRRLEQRRQAVKDRNDRRTRR